MKKKEIDVAIKILRPNIEKIFNKELDALRFLASVIEFSVKKSRRLKLVKIIDLLKEITNIEMDLRYEAAAASELKKIQLKMKDLKFHLYFGISLHKEF